MTTNLFSVIFFLAAVNLCGAQDQVKEPGINLSLMDRSASPAQDFFRFVNGTWLDKTDIPSDKTRWGSFDELRQNTDKDVLIILQDAAKDKKYGALSDQGKAINLFRCILDTVNRKRQGLKPLAPFFDKINNVKNIQDLQALMIEMEPLGGIGFFGVGVGPDAKNSNKNILYIGPGSVGLPDRDYYVADDADSKEKREKYKAHVSRMLLLTGQKLEESNADAEKILAFEIALSVPRLNRVERRDRRNTYNPMTVAMLREKIPAIEWENYLKGVGLAIPDTLIVSQPKYMSALQNLFLEGKVDQWKAYMKWTVINRYASQLSPDIEKANWEFYGKTLTGAIKQRPLDERALQVVNGSVGEALGKLYVEKKFPAAAKLKAEAMIKNIFRAFENRINNLPWMTKSTRASAIAKLHKSRIKIGYPDKWRDYSALKITGPDQKGTYFSNMLQYSRWRFQKDIEKLSQPVDKEEWGMSPQTVNAYFNPSFNEIVFPAAILQPPFYNYQADEAVNYGGIGAVIGHEISHGFDDSGSRYNADGNLVNWWSDEDLKLFTDLGSALAAQYSQLQPLPGIFVDGKFTLGENIGDLGGVNAAYDGLQLYFKENGRPGNIDGFTPEQRFFISWATIWRSKMRDEAIKNQVKTDPHSPGMYRAYVPLQNVDAFYEAFNVKEGDGMYIKPDLRVKIW